MTPKIKIWKIWPLTFLNFLWPSSQPKKSKFWKNKKKPGDIIILHLCTHVISIIDFGLFFPFYPSNSPKNENFNNKKNPLEIPSFYTIVPKVMIIGYTVPEIWCMTHVTFIFHFGLFFALLPLTAQKMKISKKWKKRLEISSFYTIVQKVMIRGYIVPEIWCMTDVIVVFHFGLFFALLPP